ncbi:MAG: FAD-dependent oxidoreductase [Chloroflexi bacterium]|nr:FAD-dependent oxidoreductase [Chloroflexota bacterium]
MQGKTNGALVIGGTRAGVRAALRLARLGVPVTLVERAPFLQTDGATPDERADALALTAHPNAEVLTNAEVTQLDQRDGFYRVTLHLRPRYVRLDRCTACGDCLPVCPVTVPGTDHRAIYRPTADAVPSILAIAKEGQSPCANACPGGIHVQGYVNLIAEGRFAEALALIREAIPFPGICGRVCHHPCEANCRRTEVDSAISIRALKRFVADWERIAAGHDEQVELPPPTGYRVAVIGAGPAGLTVAERLARLGHTVTVFEAQPVPGGMLAVGIPSYRLPRHIIREEIARIERLGVEIRLNTPIGPGLTIDDLFAQGYHAVFIGVGAHSSHRLNIPGEDAAGVVHGLRLLRAIALSPAGVSERVAPTRRKWGAELTALIPKGRATKAVIIGGGNTAMDVARSLIRLGLREVRVLYRRSRAEMPAIPEEVEEAEHEGVPIDFLVAPTRVLAEDGRVVGLECVRMELGEPDASGRRRPVPIAGSEFTLDADLVIPAIGQSPDLSFLGEGHGIAITQEGTVDVDRATCMTSRPGVFAAGDAITQPVSVIDAIASGKGAAAAIDAYLRGEAVAPAVRMPEVPIARRELSAEDRVSIPRHAVPTIPMAKRVTTYAEVELGYDPETAVAEANRCLRCGPCSECLACVRVCRPAAIEHDAQEMYRELEPTVVIVADDVGVHSRAPLQGNGLYQIADDPRAADAVVGLALARLGRFISTPAQSPPMRGERLGVFLCQCGDEIAGVVDLDAVSAYAAGLPGVAHVEILPFACHTEGAEIIRQVLTERVDRAVLAACSCCALDQVCYSCTSQRLRCKGNLGSFGPLAGRLEFVNVREQCAWVHRESEEATASAKAIVAAAVARLRGLTVPVATGTWPSQEVLIAGVGQAADVCAQILRGRGLAVKRIAKLSSQPKATPYGVRVGEVIYAAVITSDGEHANGLPPVFVLNPTESPEVAGAATAVEVLSLLSAAPVSPVRAVVDPARCRACGTCAQVCPFAAIALGEDEKGRYHAVVNSLLCQGCGVCAAWCPSGAVSAGYISDRQLEGMLKAVLS